MFSIWLIGMYIIGGLGGLITLFLIGFCFIEEDPDLLKIAAAVFAGTVLAAPLWPLWIVVAVIAGFFYGLYMLARIVKHRGLDFL